MDTLPYHQIRFGPNFSHLLGGWPRFGCIQMQGGEQLDEFAKNARNTEAHSLRIRDILSDAAMDQPAANFYLEYLTHGRFPCVDDTIFASPFSYLESRQKQSCVRPVSATHMAAGPDGFHQPSPIPHIKQQAFRTKYGASWFLTSDVFARSSFSADRRLSQQNAGRCTNVR